MQGGGDEEVVPGVIQGRMAVSRCVFRRLGGGVIVIVVVTSIDIRLQLKHLHVWIGDFPHLPLVVLYHSLWSVGGGSSFLTLLGVRQ